MATPTLVQHVATSMGGWDHYTSGNFTFTGQLYTIVYFYLPTPPLPGNLCIAAIFSSNQQTWTLADNLSDTWTAGPTATDTANSNNIQTWYLPNSPSGIYLLTLTCPSTGNAAPYLRFSEYYNIALTSPLDTSSHTTNASATATFSAGSLTPTVSGDLIWYFGVQDSAYPFMGSPTFTAGSGFTLLDADNVQGGACQDQVYNSTTAINPAVTVSSNTYQYAAVALAFKSAAAGTVPPFTWRIQSRRAFWIDNVSSITLQLPCRGGVNPLLFMFWEGYTDSSTQCLLSSITDNLGTHNTYTSRITEATTQTAAVAISQDYDTDAAITNLSGTMTVTLTFSAAANISMFRVYEIVNAPLSHGNFDQSVGTNGNSIATGNLTVLSITPTTPNGIVLHYCGMGYAEDIALVSPPAGTYNDLASYPVALTVTDSLDENNAWAHSFNPTTATITYTWSWAQVTGYTGAGYWMATASAYKGRSPCIAFTPSPTVPTALLAM